MATRTAKPTNRLNGHASTAEEIIIQPIEERRFLVTIVGVTPLIHHRLDLDDEFMRDPGQPKAVKTPPTIETQVKKATYYTADGKFAVPTWAFKGVLFKVTDGRIGPMSKQDIGTGVDFFAEDGISELAPMDCSKPWPRKDVVRLAARGKGKGAPANRYRPQFDRWGATLLMIVRGGKLTPALVVNELNRAGCLMGILERSGQQGSGYPMGRFKIGSVKEVA